MDSKKVLGISIAAFFGGVITGHIINLILSSQKNDKAQPPKLEKTVQQPKPKRNSNVKPGVQCKMVLVVRKDIKLNSGKIASQCSHATLGAYKESLKYNPDIVEQWESTGQAKIVVKVKNEKELLALREKAKNSNIISYLVADAGKTQVSPGTTTVLGLGPDTVERIDTVTKGLSLL